MEAWPQTSDSSSPWRHGRNFWFFFFSMEAWPQTSNPLAILRKLLKTSNPTLFQTSYENFSKLLTKTSQNFQSCTLPILSQSYENFLRKLPIPPLLVTKTWNFQSSRKLPFPPTWKLEKSPLLVTKPRKLLKTFYENFLRKLLKTSNPTLFQYSTFGYENLKLPVPPTWKLEKPPILHSFYNFQSSTFGRKLETLIPPLLVTKTWNFQFLQLENLKNLQSYTLPTTSNSSTFGYENLKLPILSQTSDSSNLKTWKTSNPTLFLQLPILPYLDFNEILIFSNFPPKMFVLNKSWWFSPIFFFFWQNGLFFKTLTPKKSRKCL